MRQDPERIQEQHQQKLHTKPAYYLGDGGEQSCL
nr:MAG TPA: hypothetical protein [Caudoviricetes sp.]